MTHRLRLCTVALALMGVDLVAILVTGGHSIVPFAVEVGARGLGLRLAAIGVVVTLRFYALLPCDRRMEKGRLALYLLLLPTLAQFHLLGARLSGDGISYYVLLRSMVTDGDFDLTNEYTHYEMINRVDLAVPTKTGLRRSAYSVGPAVVWTPFFLLGEGVARAEGWITGKPPDVSGYGSRHLNAVALGSLLYGFAALVLIHSLLRRHFSAGVAVGAVLFIWGATFVHWYMVSQPLYAHGASTLLAAYALWLWDRDREQGRTAWGHFFLGTVLGLAMCVRWQNGVLLILPALDLVTAAFEGPGRIGRVLPGGLLLTLGAVLGAVPQMIAWKALYDMWLLPCPPTGCDYIRLDHPWILETLFSSRHGLLSWTPVFWAGYLGLLPLGKRQPALALRLAVPLLLMTYVNMCVGDWWAGASFSNRRFDSVLPILAFGFAAAIEVLVESLHRRPGWVLPLFVVPLVTWNVVSLRSVRRGSLDPSHGLAFSRLAGASVTDVSDLIGFPTTWPASWVFAWRHRLPPGRYDLAVGRYLFFRQGSLGSRLDLTAPAVEPLLDGWDVPESRAGIRARCARGKSRLFAPLDVPEELELRFEVAAAAGTQEAAVRVNGRAAGRLPAGAAWTRASFRVPSDFWRRELNEIEIDPEGGSGVCVSNIEFVWTSRKGRHS